MSRAVDIIVPVFNEEACIDEFIERIARLGYRDALIVVDNASTDGTLARLARHPGVRVIRHARNEGYGASIRHGIVSGDGEAIVIIDADLEYPPETIPALLAALHDHPVVYASRFVAGAPPPVMPSVRRLGNRGVTALFNLLFRQHATDLYTGMKALQRHALPLGDLRRDGFEHAVELAALIALSGQAIYDVPLRYVPRSRGRSKMRHVPETFKLLRYLLGYWARCRLLGRPLHPARAEPEVPDAARR